MGQATAHCIQVLLLLKVNFVTGSLIGKAHAVEWYCPSRDLGSWTSSILAGLLLVSKVSAQPRHAARKDGLIRLGEGTQACLDL